MTNQKIKRITERSIQICGFIAVILVGSALIGFLMVFAYYIKDVPEIVLNNMLRLGLSGLAFMALALLITIIEEIIED